MYSQATWQLCRYSLPWHAQAGRSPLQAGNKHTAGIMAYRTAGHTQACICRLAFLASAGRQAAAWQAWQHALHHTTGRSPFTMSHPQ